MGLVRARVKSMGKRAYHKQEVENVNKTALLIGGTAAVIILAVMIYSFYM